MITGFNTDIEHNGTIYHVQTEDKGLRSPVILSLIYVGGEILASKRSPYNDLIASGFDQQELAERLQRQHKLICAAIGAGRIEDLKRLQQRETVHAQPEAAAPGPAPPEAEPVIAGASAEAAEAQSPAAPADSSSAAADLKDEPPAARREEPEVLRVEAEQALHLMLLEDREFRAGEVVTLRVHVARGPADDRAAVANVEVTVKILGSEFRPLILRSRTDNDGVALVHAWLPRFTSGRAAILIRAVVDDYAAELRRAIHP